MRLFPHLKIAQKLPLVVLGAALVVGSAIAGASFYFAARALEDQARQNLATIAFERSNQLSTYLSALQSDVARLAKSESAIQGLHALATTWPQITNADPSTVLRKAYITDNPNAEAERLLLDKSATVMNYNVPHSRYQPIFREEMTTRGYRDLYFFDRQGNLIYTTRKGDDFAMNFAEGAGDYAIVGPRKAVPAHVRRRACRGRSSSPTSATIGAIPETPVAFFATPVETVLGARIGVIAISITAERLSTIIGYRTGLGMSGDTIVVAVDGTGAVGLTRDTARRCAGADALRSGHQGSGDRRPGRDLVARLPRPARACFGGSGRCHPQPELGPRCGDEHRRDLRADHAAWLGHSHHRRGARSLPPGLPAGCSRARSPSPSPDLHARWANWRRATSRSRSRAPSAATRSARWRVRSKCSARTACACAR